MNQSWMSPGNSRIFDGKLGLKSKINKRTIGVLEYIDEKSKEDFFVFKNIFEKEIKDFLFKNNYVEDSEDEWMKNRTTVSHFFRTAVFYGFLNFNKRKQISLSVEGKIFLKMYKDEDYEKALLFFVNQLDNTKYPNVATKAMKEGILLFPFRVFFKLLLEQGSLSEKDILHRIIFINYSSDLKKYNETKDINDIQYFENIDYRAKKFKSWVLSSLVSVGVLDLEENKYKINANLKDQLLSLYRNINYEDMFGLETIDFVQEKVENKRYKRNPELIEKAKERDGYMCVVDNNHKTFNSNKKNYTEGHHVLPMSQQKNFSFEVDDVDNIVSLCPNCHRKIHFSDDKTELLNYLYEKQKIFFDKHNIEKEVLYSVYNS